jgi:hypothetical protein
LSRSRGDRCRPGRTAGRRAALPAVRLRSAKCFAFSCTASMRSQVCRAWATVTATQSSPSGHALASASRSAKAGKRSAVCAAEGLGQDVAGGDRIGQASRAQGVPGQEFAGRGRLWTSVGQLRTPCSGLPEPVRHLVSQVSLPQPLPLWSRDERVDCRTAQRDSVAVERLPTGRPRARKRLAGAAGPPGPRHRRYCRPEQLPRPSFACGDRGRSSGIGDSSPHA